MRLAWFLLLVTLANATDYVTIRTGNWHNTTTGQTPWATGSCASPVESLATPGSGDRAIICTNTLHCESATTCTIGDSPANDSGTPALQSSTATGTGVFAMDAGSTFVFKGSIRQSNATWTAGDGVTITHDSSAGAGTPKYTWRVGQASLGTARVQLTGTSPSRVTFGVAGSSGDFGGFTSSFSNAGQVAAAYTDFTHCGTAGSVNCMNASLDGTSGSPTLSLDHSTVDSTSGGVVISVVSGNAVVSITDSTLQGRDSSNRAVSLGTSTISALTSGTRIFARNILLGGTLYDGMDMIVQDNFGYVSSNSITNIETKSTATVPSITAANWKNNIFWLTTTVINNQAAHLPAGVLQRTYFLQSSTAACTSSQNYHWLYMASADSVLDSWIFETDCGASQSNVIQNIASSVGAFTHEVKNSIALPGSNGAGPNLYDYDATGTCDQATLFCPAASVHHNTVMGTNGTAECGVAGGEGVNWVVGAYARISDNILWQLASAAGCIVGWGTPVSADPVAGTFQATDYNWLYNLSGGSLYRHAPSYANPAPPGPHDSSGNPQFVDPTRNFLTWSQTLNPGDATWADVMAHFVARDAGYTPTALIDYVRGGFIPGNAAVATAGSDGSYVGAVAPAAGAGGSFLSGTAGLGGNGGIH